MNRIKSITFFSIILFCISSQFSFSQPSRFSFNNYTNGKGDTLYYRQLYPDADTMRKYPLVIFLHGSGERGDTRQVLPQH